MRAPLYNMKRHLSDELKLSKIQGEHLYFQFMKSFIE